MQEMMSGIRNNLVKAMSDIMQHNRAAEKKAATAVITAAAAAATEAKVDKPRNLTSPKLDLRNFTKMEKFSGGEAAWKDWSFDFKTMVSAINPSMSKWFKKFET